MNFNIPNPIDTIFQKVINNEKLSPIEKLKLQFKILVEVYFISEGNRLILIPYNVLFERLNSNELIENEVRKNIDHLIEEDLLEYKGFKVSITHCGIDVVENATLQPEFQSSIFPKNISKIVGIDANKYSKIIEWKKNRWSFLEEAYRVSEGDDSKPIDQYQIGTRLGYDRETTNRILIYLEDEGLIETHYIGGPINITYACIKVFENDSNGNNSILYLGLYPQLKDYTSSLTNALYNLNTISQVRLGCKIFKSDSKLLDDLRIALSKLNENPLDKNFFIQNLLLIGTLIDDVYYDELNKHVRPENHGSINILKSLLDAKGISYDANDISVLRRLHKIRNTHPPIHNALSESVKIIETFGIKFPITDYAEASEILLIKFIASLNSIGSSINNKE